MPRLFGNVHVAKQASKPGSLWSSFFMNSSINGSCVYARREPWRQHEIDILEFSFLGLTHSVWPDIGLLPKSLNGGKAVRFDVL